MITRENSNIFATDRGDFTPFQWRLQRIWRFYGITGCKIAAGNFYALYLRPWITDSGKCYY